MEEKSLEELRRENDMLVGRIRGQLDAIIHLINEINNELKGGYNG